MKKPFYLCSLILTWLVLGLALDKSDVTVYAQGLPAFAETTTSPTTVSTPSPVATLTGIAQQPGSLKSILGNVLFAVCVIGAVAIVVLAVVLYFRSSGNVALAESGPPAETVPVETPSDQTHERIAPKWFPIVFALVPFIVTLVVWLVFLLLRYVIHIDFP